MPDLARLHIVVDSTSATTAVVNLDSLTGAGKRAETTVVSLGRTAEAQFLTVTQSAERAAQQVHRLGQEFHFVRTESGLYLPETMKLEQRTKAAATAQAALATASTKTGKGLADLAKGVGLNDRGVTKLASILFIAQGAAAGADRSFVALGANLLTSAIFGGKFGFALTAIATVIGLVTGKNKEAAEAAKASREAFEEQMRSMREKAADAREALLALYDAQSAKGSGRDASTITEARNRRKEIEDLEEYATELESVRQRNLRIKDDLRFAAQFTERSTGFLGLRSGLFNSLSPADLDDVRDRQRKGALDAKRNADEITTIYQRLVPLKEQQKILDEEENKLLRERAVLHLAELGAINSSRDATLASMRAVEEGRNGQIAASEEELTGLQYKRAALAQVLRIYGGQNAEVQRQLNLLDAQLGRSREILSFTKRIDEAERARNQRNFLSSVQQSETEARSITAVAEARKQLADAQGDRGGAITAQQELSLLEARISREASLVALEQKLFDLRDPKRRPAGVTDQDVKRFEGAERAKIEAKFNADRLTAINASTAAQRELNRAVVEEALALEKVADSRDQAVAELMATEAGQNTRLVGMRGEIAALEKEREMLRRVGAESGEFSDSVVQRILLLTAEIDKQKTILDILTKIDDKEKARLQREFDRGLESTRRDTESARTLSKARLNVEAAKAVSFGNPQRVAGMERELEVLEAQIEKSKALFELETKLIELRDPKRHPELDAKRIAAFEAAERAKIEAGFAGSLGSAFEKERIAELERVTGFVRDIGEMVTRSLSDAIVDGVYNGFDNIGQIGLQLSKTFFTKVIGSWMDQGLNSILSATFAGGGGGGLLGALGNLFGGQGAQFQAAAATAGATFTASTGAATATFVTGVSTASAGLIAAAAQAAALMAAAGAGGGAASGISGLVKGIAPAVSSVVGGGGGLGGVSIPSVLPDT